MKFLSQSRLPSHPVAHELAQEALRQSGKLVMPSIGRSMVPAIWPGDKLVVERARDSNVGLGDIVLFTNGSRFVAHRVIEKKTENKRAWVRTRGDSMTAADAPIEQCNILGKVSFIVRNGKCFAAKKDLRRSERALATLLRRSETAARVVVGIHRLSRATPEIV